MYVCLSLSTQKEFFLDFQPLASYVEENEPGTLAYMALVSDQVQHNQSVEIFQYKVFSQGHSITKHSVRKDVPVLTCQISKPHSFLPSIHVYVVYVYYAYACMCEYMWVYSSKVICEYVCKCPHACMHVFIIIIMYICIYYAHTHIYTYKYYVYVYIYIYIYIYILCMYMHMRAHMG